MVSAISCRWDWTDQRTHKQVASPRNLVIARPDDRRVCMYDAGCKFQEAENLAYWPLSGEHKVKRRDRLQSVHTGTPYLRLDSIACQGRGSRPLQGIISKSSTIWWQKQLKSSFFLYRHILYFKSTSTTAPYRPENALVGLINGPCEDVVV